MYSNSTKAETISNYYKNEHFKNVVDKNFFIDIR